MFLQEFFVQFLNLRLLILVIFLRESFVLFNQLLSAEFFALSLLLRAGVVENIRALLKRK